MSRIRFVPLALAATLLLAACTAPHPDPAEPVAEGSASPTPSATSPQEQTLPNDDPRCKLWSSPQIMLSLILHPVADVDHFPTQALEATCRWEVAKGTNTIKWPHTFEALWLDASDATFGDVTAAFEADGATVTVEELGVYGFVRRATISSTDGTGELDLRDPNHDFPATFVTLKWTRAA